MKSLKSPLTCELMVVSFSARLQGRLSWRPLSFISNLLANIGVRIIGQNLFVEL